MAGAAARRWPGRLRRGAFAGLAALVALHLLVVAAWVGGDLLAARRVDDVAFLLERGAVFLGYAAFALFVAWGWLIRGWLAAAPLGLLALLPWSLAMLMLTWPPFFAEPGMEEGLPALPIHLLLGLGWGLAALGSAGAFLDETLAR